jgi:hypothetical protein
MATAFDSAIETMRLRQAADEYASRYGDPGSFEYRAAWIRFRTRVQNWEDLEHYLARRRMRRRSDPTGPREKPPAQLP